jgi:hypothetical protein
VCGQAGVNLIAFVGEFEDFGADLTVRCEEGGDVGLGDADGVGDIFDFLVWLIFVCTMDARAGKGRTGWSSRGRAEKGESFGGGS